MKECVLCNSIEKEILDMLEKITDISSTEEKDTFLVEGRLLKGRMKEHYDATIRKECKQRISFMVKCLRFFNKALEKRV
jgi:hypothetical protein